MPKVKGYGAASIESRRFLQVLEKAEIKPKMLDNMNIIFRSI